MAALSNLGYYWCPFWCSGLLRIIGDGCPLHFLDYVYRNRAHGRLGFGRLIDRVYLDAIGWRAIRARRVLLKQGLKQEVECKLVHGRPIRLLDAAAGLGRYLQELVQENDLGRDELLVLCRDLSQDGLMQGARQAEEAGLQNVFYECGNAFEPAPTDAMLGEVPHCRAG
jgi:hypothetical protein